MESDYVPKGLYFCDSVGFKEVMFIQDKELNKPPKEKSVRNREDREEER